MIVALGSSWVLASFALGLAHAFDPDHLAAVTALAAEHPSWRRALRCAAHWALGHGVAVLSLGIVLLGSPLGGALQGTYADLVVAVSLIALGLWTAWTGARTPAHTPRWTSLTASAFGILHGTAGVAAVLGLLGLTRASLFVGISSLVAFNAGVFAAMFALALGFGSLYENLARRSRWRAGVRIGIGGITVLVGLSMLRG